IVTIFDCCHSGDNTRNAALVGASYDGVRERRVTDKAGRAFPQRLWSEFLFSDTIKEGDIKNKKPAEFLPQGTHVQMAACESNQVALEIAREGVFTQTLLKTLTDCGSNISYNGLRSRIRQYMRAGFEQTPRIYMPLHAERLLRRGFLNRTIEPHRMVCEATRSKQQGWQLNVGAIHGVNTDSRITLFDPMDLDKTHTAQVRKAGIFVDYTLLDVAGLDTKATYKAEISDLMKQELVLELENHDGDPKEIGALTKELAANASGCFSLGGEKGAAESENDSGKAQRADYTFHVRSGEVYLTQPDDPYRPLVRPILYLEDENHASTLGTLQHVSRWHFIKNLRNEEKPDNFPAQPLKIELSRILADGTSVPAALINGSAELNYEKSGSSWKGTLQIKITNTTPQDLYVAAAYLSKEFQCFLDFLPQRVQLLEAGKSVFLGPKGKDRIALKLGDVEREYNWPQTVEALKFIISTEEFSAESLTQDALPGPLTTADRDKIGSGKTRGLDTEEDAPLEFSGWLTQTLSLVFKNPVYNEIPADTLQALLEWDETAYFAAGLYCEVEPDETGQPTIWKLKKGLVVPEEDKGLFDDMKLWLGNQIETAQRRKRYRNLKKDPNRLRLVAEGDSWFQYPIILQDTLDQLYKVYAIRSFAEAGDTLENYLKTKDKQYLNAIGEEDAKFFLVSGGGNDVLGDQFQHFLREVPDADDYTPRKYLNQKMFEQLDKLDALYIQMFDELLARYPDLHILLHCYDYLIPVDTNIPGNKKKSSWTGKHMVGKGIAPQKERETLIRYIVDEFAGRLTALTQKAEYQDRVTFVDTRGLVPRTLWFDEIHPNNAGYQIVADKFIGEIERIKAQKKSPLMTG
ncbi:SGNH/GDSL hydrolase family protein, partial [Persicitalea sp.]|uniref:SGNH/GDSL hydrolase family protein n=1 Tax=Persicitalea sp. TaxID=3100273 RepID=UPI003594177E